MRVAFIHPDLGLGGAERLIVDAAVGLRSRGHEVTIYTSFRDGMRCFDEVAPGREKVPVRVVAKCIPRSLGGKFHAILTAIRCAAIAIVVAWEAKPDIGVCDIVALPLVILWLMRIPSLFYCHFPDKELVKTLNRPRSSRITKLYRWAVDSLEEAGLRCANLIICNSKFTQDTFINTFGRLEVPKVIYPCVREPQSCISEESGNPSEHMFLSINRFERKKNIDLAIDAIAEVVKLQPNLDCRLVVAGGYDVRLQENIDYYRELEQKTKRLQLTSKVQFLQNLAESQKRDLIKKAVAVIYTPAGEHFGIVPLEAMTLGTPVIATNVGGPVETVKDGVTGLLCAPEPREFANAMIKVISDPTFAADMGRAGQMHVRKEFSIRRLAQNFDAAIHKAAGI